MLAASLAHSADTASRYTGHNRRVLSQPPETTRVPSGLNATLDTQSVWPISGLPTGCPVVASHKRTVLSHPPETMLVPSGLYATLSTGAVWPVSGSPTCCPVAASDTRTVLSSLPETKRGPSGLSQCPPRTFRKMD